MSTSPANSRTNLELLNDLRTPVGRFYPLDLHVHSLGSYDVCMSGSFESLPERLRSEVLETLKDSTLELPLGRQPVDAGEFDEKMASSAALVQSFYQSLLDRRNELAETEGLAEGDNWAIVGITDHNTSHFSSKLSQWAWDKKSSDHLIVFPGLELEVEFPLEGASKGCRVHILCLFAPCTSASDIRIAINDAQPAGHQPWCFGSSISTSDLPALVSALRSHAAYPAICIGAHVWSRKGIEREPKKAILASVEADIIRVEGELERARSEAAAADIEALERQLARLQARLQDSEGLHGDVLALIGKCGFDALQVKDQSQEVHYRRLHRFRDEHGRAVPLVSSDAHTPSNVFTCGSGIPYGKVSIDAIADGSPTDLLNELRGHTLRFGETRMTYASPGRVTHWIEGLEIVPDASDARGFWTVEDSTEKAFTFALSRNLNCFVGGRGSGKSAGVEAIAFLSRESEFQEEARKNPKEQADWYVRARATLRGCRLRLVWKSSGPTEIGGLHKRALIVSRYFDPAGRHENFDLRDARGQAIVDDAITLPQVRILRVHEIEQTAKPTNLRELFDDLCGSRIDSLSAEIDGVRSELEVQRSRVVSACERAAELTGEGGPLRQYGIRKKQFEAVDTPELRERFEEVDHADDVAKSLSNAREQWNEVNATESLDMLEGELDSFFEATTEGLVDEQQEVLPGYETLHRLVAGPQTEADSHRSDIVSSLQATKDAISRFDVALSEETDSAANMLKERRDALASEGLPTGSSERETKKRASRRPRKP